MSWNGTEKKKPSRIVADVDATVRRRFDILQILTDTKGKPLIEQLINEKYESITRSESNVRDGKTSEFLGA